MTAPQPYRDPTYPPRQRRPTDPLLYDRDKHHQNSEFGSALVLCRSTVMACPQAMAGLHAQVPTGGCWVDSVPRHKPGHSVPATPTNAGSPSIPRRAHQVSAAETTREALEPTLAGGDVQ